MGLETQHERADVDLSFGAVALGKTVVVEPKGRVAGADLRDVVTKRRTSIAVLNEVTARAGERVAASQARDLGDAIHAIARLGSEHERDFFGAELRTNDFDRERSKDVRERALSSVESEKRDESIDGWQKDDAFAAESDSASIETKPRRTEPGLMYGNALEHP
jgi:hypothetical protein